MPTQIVLLLIVKEQCPKAASKKLLDVSVDPLKRDAHITLSVVVVKKVFKIFFKTVSLKPASYLAYSPDTQRLILGACETLSCLPSSEEAHYRDTKLTCKRYFKTFV